MKKILFSLFLLAGAYNLLAQKTINDPNAEKRTVTGFHGIDVSTGIKLVITEGTSEEVAVSAAKPEFREKIITEVKDGILHIRYETKLGAINRRKEDKDLRAYVSYKSLDHLDVVTGAQLEINGVLTATTMDLKSNTGGTVHGEINISTLTVNQNTGSKITFSGKAATLEVDGDTGSQFSGEDLQTSNCSASASTGARISITVDKELSAKADTGGRIRYRGDGTIRDVRSHTGGSISKI